MFLKNFLLLDVIFLVVGFLPDFRGMMGIFFFLIVSQTGYYVQIFTFSRQSSCLGSRCRSWAAFTACGSKDSITFRGFLALCWSHAAGPCWCSRMGGRHFLGWTILCLGSGRGCFPGGGSPACWAESLPSWSFPCQCPHPPEPLVGVGGAGA